MNQFNSQIRPVSPHLTIYKPQFTSVLSIYHRISGVCLVALFLFVPFILTWIDLNVIMFKPSILSLLNLFTILFYGIYTVILILLGYHFLNGIRHLGWDFGITFSISQYFPIDISGISKSSIVILVCIFVLFVRILFHLL